MPVHPAHYFSSAIVDACGIFVLSDSELPQLRLEQPTIKRYVTFHTTKRLITHYHKQGGKP